MPPSIVVSHAVPRLNGTASSDPAPPFARGAVHVTPRGYLAGHGLGVNGNAHLIAQLPAVKLISLIC
jgi:hypothetical protein